MSIQTFGDWLYATPISTTFRETTWIIPTVQSLHILAIAVVVGSALVSELRLAGVLATDESPARVVRRYLPWIWSALVVLLASGMLLIVAEPARTLGNTVFWAKMALVLLAFLATLLLRRPLLRDEARPAAKTVAWLLLVVWIAVIFCGRFIAYT
ncbi:DUF6644 family protein [Novosphingobium pokkalii]|uniref:DUF6644 family protein n=1 Tax=Novosphingobium pokkalii TaxID=1770194 RepID=A0ABV7V8C5_9SPHN|nr:DUF6644 family protein [Novosphingobium pokkalii]GHC98400.1 hypothetical protein GCM10019060_30120 [Novosphingobium pokkalii]